MLLKRSRRLAPFPQMPPHHRNPLAHVVARPLPRLQAGVQALDGRSNVPDAPLRATSRAPRTLAQELGDLL